MWNAETAQFLHNWYATPEGTYAITRKPPFQHLISQWPLTRAYASGHRVWSGYLWRCSGTMDLMSRGLIPVLTCSTWRGNGWGTGLNSSWAARNISFRR